MTALREAPNRIFDLRFAPVDETTRFLSPRVQRLADWWRAEAGGSGVLFRRRFDVLDHPVLVPLLFLIERTGLNTVRPRVYGEGVITLLGCNPARRSRAAIPDPCVEFASVLDSGRCWRRTGRIAAADGGVTTFETVECPLADDGGRARFVLGVMDRLSRGA